MKTDRTQIQQKSSRAGELDRAQANVETGLFPKALVKLVFEHRPYRHPQASLSFFSKQRQSSRRLMVPVLATNPPVVPALISRPIPRCPLPARRPPGLARPGCIMCWFATPLSQFVVAVAPRAGCRRGRPRSQPRRPVPLRAPRRHHVRDQQLDSAHWQQRIMLGSDWSPHSNAVR